MTRIIKFRAWDEEKKRFVYMDELLKEDNLISVLLYATYGYAPIGPRGGQDKWILEQFIDLKDKNGVEIYEGDIVKYRHLESDGDEVSTVEWGGIAETGFYPFQNCGRCGDSVAGYNYDKIEVIGNVHQNLELLK